MNRAALFGFVAAVGLSLGTGCYDEGALAGGSKAKSRTPVVDGGPIPADTADASRDAGGTGFPCTPARTNEANPARTPVMGVSSESAPTMFTSDLFLRFKSSCGACHVEGSDGNFHVTPKTFVDDLDPKNFDAGAGADVLGLIFSENPDKIMPPDSAAASTRDPETDPYLRLGALLRTWYEQGRPPTIFKLKPEGSGSGKDGGARVNYQMTEAVGNALTNLGNCIPSKEAIDVLPDDAVDEMFENATELPEYLDQTDLTTFDSAALALKGVVAFVPAYPLWADGAHKIRYVKVPHGQSIRFDKATQQFVIPENTRFYKTFLKRVVEKDGTEKYRKMETRLIVARAQNPLFGSYDWDPQSLTEHEAKLVREPLRNQKPFTDVLETYVVDEAKNESITAEHDANPAAGDLTAMLQKGGAIRHYAIPGSERCIQCHMGSPSNSFVLGFTPLQINRPKEGTSGVLEPPGEDELTQLRRLIDYGIITGVDDVKDILPLEKSQGKRTPRNDYELLAQGYMIGNCAHCHNPKGFPSIQNPIIANVLDFLPGPEDYAGIFQFPLDKVSPRIKRDLGGSVDIPYITPSLVDYPGVADKNHSAFPLSDSSAAVPASVMVLAPWRSLIYRNVDSPFAYADDLALFPHMPMNTPGFDCRLPKIMGDWMVSIPAVRKHPDIAEGMIQGNVSGDTGVVAVAQLHDNAGTDTEEQPYREVLPPDPALPDVPAQQAAYDAAKQAAEDRLLAYHEGGDKGLGAKKQDYARYKYCPDTADIIDATVTGADRAHLVPSDLTFYEGDDGKKYAVPVDYSPVPEANSPYTEDIPPVKVPFGTKISWPSDGVPDRPHWVITDTTERPPPWGPRRDDWAKVLRDHQVQNLDPDALVKETNVVNMLSPPASGVAGVRLTPAVLAYTGTEIPYGLWQKPLKDGCAKKLEHAHKVSDFQGPSRPKWFDDENSGATPTDFVYEELPGAAVFNMVCINCHGPDADSHGRQADTLQTMTGGNARVANLRDGFFGPTTAPGTNRQPQFDITPGTSGPSSDDWAARYMAWMALGGTNKLIPRAILSVVASTPVLGVPRSLPGIDGANMLGPVQTLCAEFFRISSWSLSPPDLGSAKFSFEYPGRPQPGEAWGNWLWKEITRSRRGILLTQNGDAELWASLCTLDNPMPVARISLSVVGSPSTAEVRYVPAALYPAGTPIGNDRGGVDDSFLPTNHMPWCIANPDGPETESYIATLHGDDGKPLPICPKAVDDPLVDTTMSYDDIELWSYRGAINGGLAVFVYLDKVSRGYTRVPFFDQCDALP